VSAATRHASRSAALVVPPAALRYASAAAAGSLVVVGLFALIQGLIIGGDVPLGTRAHTIDFSRLSRNESERTRPRTSPHKPDPPKRVPAYAQVAELSPVQVPVMPIESAAPTFAIAPAASTRPSLSVGAEPGPGSTLMPIYREPPRYPREALMNRTEGWVEIEFTITSEGGVKDAVVVGAQPDRVFERDAMRAIAHWRFRPFIVDGVAVERRARQIIEFTLDQAG